MHLSARLVPRRGAWSDLAQMLVVIWRVLLGRLHELPGRQLGGLTRLVVPGVTRQLGLSLLPKLNY